MYDTFFHKGLKRTVDGYTVKFFTGPPFNITMREGIFGLQKKREDFFTAVSNVEAVFLQHGADTAYGTFFQVIYVAL